MMFELAEDGNDDASRQSARDYSRRLGGDQEAGLSAVDRVSSDGAQMKKDSTTAVPLNEGLDFSQPSTSNAVYNLDHPSTFWRLASQQTFFGVAALCRGFLYGLNKPEVHGLPRFLELLKSRQNPIDRQRGLVTVSNHVSVMDDPIVWGMLPLSFYAFQARYNNRFGFGSHDICFQGGLLSHFFTLGQVLPTHRLAHSPYGGPAQPAMMEAIRLLSPIKAGDWTVNRRAEPALGSLPSWPRHPIDPFTDPTNLHGLAGPYFKTHERDERFYHAPSRYASNQFAWIHIFPEGMIHQSPTYHMRYFKWGIARLILEPPVCPDVVPMWIEGTDQVMHESREWPRFIPRAGKNISVTFGDRVDTEKRFGDLRRRWRKIRDHRMTQLLTDPSSAKPAVDAAARDAIYEHNYLGEMICDEHNQELRELWIETTRRVREEVLKLRKERGWPDEDPKASAAQTWAREGTDGKGRMQDGTWIGDP